VDGVLTEGGIYMDDAGAEYKRFDVRDGHGIKLLQRFGVGVALITGRTSGVVTHRAAELGIEHVYQGRVAKAPALDELLTATGMPAEAMAVVGDDVVDLPLMVRAGLAVTVADAHPAVTGRAHWTTAAAGGRGAVREVADRILRVQGHEATLIEGYLEAGG
jgi:3-deoxy-D-manno-octulosonate 8-phosphate phosphatase (KDO 8-P phosphatase)